MVSTAPSSILVDRYGQPMASVPLTAEINQNWVNWGIQWQDFVANPDLIHPDAYTRMMETDETVFSGMEFLTQSVLARMGEYTHPVDTIQEFVRANLSQMEGSFMSHGKNMLTALGYGHSATEILWKYKDGGVWVRGLQTLHPRTITYDIYKDGPNKNKLRNVWQNFRRAYEAQIPPEKCIIYAHDSEFGNFYGKSRLKRAFKNHFIKDVLLKVMGTTCERYSSPYTVCTGPLNSKVNNKGREQPYTEYMADVLKNMGATGTLILDQQTKVELMYAGQGFGKDIHGVIGYLNRSIHQAIGLPALIADAGSVGSYSLGQQHFEQFILLLEQIYNEFVLVLIDQLVRRLIIYNFGEQDDYGTFAFEDFKVEDQLAVANCLALQIQSGILSLERLEDVNYCRERLGLPLLTEEDLQSFSPEPLPSLENTHDSVPADAKPRANTNQFSNVSTWRGQKRKWLAEHRKVLTFSQTGNPLAKCLSNLLLAS